MRVLQTSWNNVKQMFLYKPKQAYRLITIALALARMMVPNSQAADAEPYEQEPFNYSAATPHDGVSRIEEQIASGELKMGSTDREAIEALLRRLEIPKESQLLV